MAASVVGMLVVGGCSAEPIVEPDGRGPMSLGVSDSGFVSLRPPENLPPDGEWSGTFGNFVPCITTEDGPARITGLKFADSSGPKPLSALPYVRTFDSTTDTPIASMKGEARDLDIGSTELREGVQGFEVGTVCRDLMGFDGELADEILISLTADQRGAHVGDVTVSYVTADGREHAVWADWDFYLCGSEVSDEFCNPGLGE